MLPQHLRFCAAIALVCFAGISNAAAEAIALSKGGAALMPIVVAENAATEIREDAAKFAAMLGKLSGGKFEVTSGDGTKGIAFGAASDFPVLKIAVPEKPDPVAGREDYLLESHGGGLRVLGATPEGARDAMWDVLYRLGYRQFFPGKNWEVIPPPADLSLDVAVREHPAYLARRIWFGGGSWDISKEPYAEWCAKNRMRGAFRLSSGHSYGGYLSKNKAEFAAHPEYLALVDGVRKGSKFCISNPGLRALIVKTVLANCAKNEEGDSISMDPSDGGGWCECPECAKIGSITDQALTLANEVAEAVHKEYPGKIIGMYAYNYHSPPPNIRVNPNVAISVATAFIKGGLTLDEIIEGWRAKGAQIGIREYFSVNTWDRDLPAAARGSNLKYLARTIPEFYAKGALYHSAESSDNWGPNGLGYYIASRLFWKPADVAQIDALKEDFFTRAFGSAKEPMRQFYEQIDGSQPHLVQKDQLGRMFRALDAARKLNPPPDVLARINDLVLYSRYVDLFHLYSQAKGTERQADFETLIRYSYRIRESLMTHSYGLYRDLVSRDKSVTMPEEASFKKPEKTNPWKKDTKPFAETELVAYLSEGIARNPTSEITFTPAEFSSNLVSAAALNPPANAVPGTLENGRGMQTFYTMTKEPNQPLALKITGGLIAHYRDRGNVKIEVTKIGGASETGELETVVAEDRSVPPDGQLHDVSIALKEAGVYRVVINDGKDSTLVQLASALPWTVKSSEAQPMSRFYKDAWTMYFYVPRGTKEIGFFAGDNGEIRDSAGRPVFLLNGRDANFYSTPVPDGEDGKFWHFKNAKGSVRLLTVPPYFAKTPGDLLLPAEVVAKDAAK